MKSELKILVSGDRGLLIKLGEKIDPEISRRVHLLTAALKRKALSAVEEIVPGYCTLFLLYNPLKISCSLLVNQVREIAVGLRELELPPQRMIEVPVCYGGRYGPDLGEVASYHGLLEEEVIQAHISVTYLVYFIGFCPGFPYMGEVPPLIATPRLPKPRVHVPAGSVGIAGNQTGIYPIETPGGWRLIGMTPLKVFDPSRDPPSLFRPGDRIKFCQISPSDFESIQTRVEQGTYELQFIEGSSE